METRSIILGEEDAATLADLLEELTRASSPDHIQIALLEDTLRCAEVQPTRSVPRDVVKIHSVITIRDLRAGITKRYVLVLPELADVGRRLLYIRA